MNLLSPSRSLSLINDVMKAVAAVTGDELDLKLRSRVELKLRRRYQDLGYHSLLEYGIYFEQNESSELRHVVAELTAHESGFFKEFIHFESISETLLPEWLPLIRSRPDRTLRVWSVGCGRGQEAYSLALYLKHFLKSFASDIKISVTATDPDAELIQIAKTGFYPRSEMRDLPLYLMADHFQRSTQNHVEGMKVKPSLSDEVQFEVQDLSCLGPGLRDQQFDLVFCRQVLTHFNESQVKEAVRCILSYLHPAGCLVTGLSESLEGLNLDVRSSGSSVYRFAANQTDQPRISAAPLKDLASARTLKRVFCVSDSLSVQTLTKQILKQEAGFEIVGEAMSLEDAFLKKEQWKSADLATFYFEIKKENLAAYLEKNSADVYPPSLLMSSADLANLEGVEDLLQSNLPFELTSKPVLNHLAQFGEIFRAKLNTLDLDFRARGKTLKNFEQFNKNIPITSPHTKVRVLLGGALQLQKTAEYVRELQGVQAPIYLFFEECEASLLLIADELKRRSGRNCVVEKDLAKRLEPGLIRVLDFEKNFIRAAALHAGDRASIGVLGDLCTASSLTVLKWSPAQLLIEDLGLGHGTHTLNLHSSEVFPASSFASVSADYLEKK